MKTRYRKLGREKAWGLAHLEENLIEIDDRLVGLKRLEIIIHEALHLLFPLESETNIKKKARKLAKLLWSQQYRKIEVSSTEK